MRVWKSAGVLAVAAWAWMGGTAAAQAPLGQSAQRLFIDRCSECHDDGDDPAPKANAGPKPAPTLMQLRPLSADSAFRSMIGGGGMLRHAEGWNIDDRRRVAEFITGKRLALAGSVVPAEGRCQTPAPSADFSKLPLSNGWGLDPGNTRFQPAAQAGLPAASIPKLKLKWAFGFPGVLQAYGQPAVAAGRVYVGTDTGVVYAIDAKTGCYQWAVGADASVRTGIVIGRSEFTDSGSLLYFGDIRGNVYAADARNGSLSWRQRVDNHVMARITGTPVLSGGRLYVTVAGAGEEAQATNPNYECCSFRGSVVALDANTGTILWKAWTIAQEPRKVRTTAEGIDRFAPAGASVVGSPTIDVARGAVYVGTGNAFTDPAPETTDAVLAFSITDGHLLWSHQLLAGDAIGKGPGFDVMAAPILRKVADGRSVLLVGQKSGTVYALDPDKQGAELWKTPVSKGGEWGGIGWGMTADAQHVYVPVADFSPKTPGAVSPEAGALVALRLENGQVAWTAKAAPVCAKPVGCHPGKAAAITATPDAVFAGSLDGMFRAYAVKDGAVLWETNTAQAFDTVDQVGSQGGSITVAGPAIAGGMVFVTSGSSTAGVPGNVLLAFAPDPPPAAATPTRPAAAGSTPKGAAPARPAAARPAPAK